jgi:mannose-6-phosphate isomerase class I
MTCSDDVVNHQLNALIRRLEDSNNNNVLDQLILRLHRDYPCDRGVLCPLFLNYLVLSPGEAFYMEANVLHAYISGDCVECMALSDNTVRAGLTPKHKDVDTLLNMLNYKYALKIFESNNYLLMYFIVYRSQSAIQNHLVPLKINDHLTLYRSYHINELINYCQF